MAIIFDVDGTLLATEEMYIGALDYTLKQQGIEKPYDTLYRVFGLPAYESLVNLKIPNPEVIQVAWRKNLEQYRDSIRLYDGVADMLAALSAQQETLGVVTSNTPEEFEAHHDRFGIEQFFSDFVFAGMTKKMKPAPDPILLALSRLSIQPEETIYIGDSVHDMGAAHAAGVKFGMAAWGVPNQEVFEQQADYIFDRPSDVVNWAQNN
ncbi:HAD family hydrolase [Weissella diestrammenae]|uniref:HAD family hydrolase n=1 Tax=Weissella diestrammenae TaxID=1162633 RepID=UPI001FAD0D2B|nr:HAD family hydrolase [Weissella diestrammenae]